MDGAFAGIRAESARNFRIGKQSRLSLSSKADGQAPCSITQTHQDSDANLLDLIAEGDALAMRVFFTRHNARVGKFVFRLVGDESLAEDLVSDVFVDVWRNADRFKGESQVSTWIFAIARFKALSFLRRRKYNQLDEAEAAAIPDLADDPERLVEKKDRIAILRKCMSHLSPAHREVIELAYYQDKSVGEVAELIGVPANTVKTRMFHARKRISELLQQAETSRTYQ
jgi:RNA polymerase sigma-70 factor, ECF subfamily